MDRHQTKGDSKHSKTMKLTILKCADSTQIMWISESGESKTWNLPECPDVIRDAAVKLFQAIDEWQDHFTIKK
jgi:hypothetical protein